MNRRGEYAYKRSSPNHMKIGDTVLVGIDGTGVESDSEYARAYQNSFVNQIYAKSNIKNKYYFRGPMWDGYISRRLELDEMLNATTSGGMCYTTANKKYKILLMGWSRGGAACIHLAKKLQERKIKVKAMLLFDPVDRDLVLSTGNIPSNVENVMNILRDPETGSWESFGNAFRGPIDNNSFTKYQQVDVYGTHSAIGGVLRKSPKNLDSMIHEIEPNYPDLLNKTNHYLSAFPTLRSAVTGLIAGAGLVGASNLPLIGEHLDTNVSFRQDIEARQKIEKMIQPFLDKHGYYGRNIAPL